MRFSTAQTVLLLCLAAGRAVAAGGAPPLRGTVEPINASAGYAVPSQPRPGADAADAASSIKEAEQANRSGTGAEEPASPLPAAGEDFEYVDLPESYNASQDGDLTGQDCAQHPNSHNCALYRLCRHRRYCVVNGYMIVPGHSLPGMEAINGHTAGHWDFLWGAARSQCGSDSCVLITNPVGHRTQDQMHIHFRHYNGAGAALKGRLERAVCGKRGWRHFSECGSAKARLFSGMPGVFSTVAHAYGGGSLANVGITVWFTHRCGGGQKTIVLATTHCSIEHTISAR
mmetsp:Transcript_25619/g.77332  ORF Transcript_25619/g.77332 Transcript_25619/m.77332 type:complete len:286 (+) Transcript_25619:78-935(+)